MNKSINEYTIRCTVEQAKKALELGASIEFEQTIIHDWSTGKPVPYPDIAIDKDGEPILIKPTSEQMIGWLETKGFRFEVEYCTMYCMMVHINDTYICNPICAYSRPEATLAAIDAALDYLSNNKE